MDLFLFASPSTKENQMEHRIEIDAPGWDRPNVPPLSCRLRQAAHNLCGLVEEMEDRALDPSDATRAQEFRVQHRRMVSLIGQAHRTWRRQMVAHRVACLQAHPDMLEDVDACPGCGRPAPPG